MSNLTTPQVLPNRINGVELTYHPEEAFEDVDVGKEEENCEKVNDIAIRNQSRRGMELLMWV